MNIGQAELPLFEEEPHKLDIKVSEEKVIAPLNQVLNSVNPTSTPEPLQRLESSEVLKQSLDALFPEQEYEEKDIQMVKSTLGAIANEFTPDQLKNAALEIQHLSSTWLDNFERNLFNGLTLTELLHEKGGR